MYIKDIVRGLRLERAKLRRPIEVHLLRPEIWILYAKDAPILVVVAKKHKEEISQTKVVTQLLQHLNQFRNYFGQSQVFGLIATMEEFRICWLPENDECAASPSISFQSQNHKLSTISYSTLLHGTPVLSGADRSIHHYIASVILKACNAARSINDLPQLRDRLVLRTDNISQLYSRVSTLIDSIDFYIPHSRSRKFLLLKDLHCGSEANVWLGSSVARNRVGCACALKFMFEWRPKSAKKQAELWVMMGYKAWVQNLPLGGHTLIIPFTITMRVHQVNINKYNVEWDREPWNLISPMESEANRKLVENAIETITPIAALEIACSALLAHNVKHEDMEWRHVALIISYDSGTLGLGAILGGMRLRITPGWVDFGRASIVKKADRAAAVEHINNKKAELLPSLV